MPKHYEEIYRKTAFKKIEPMTFDYSKPISPEKMYPVVTLPISSIPESKKWEIGKTYQIALEVVQKSMRLGDMHGKDHSEVTFEVKKVKPI